MSDNTNSAHEFTEGSEFKTETKEMEGELKPTDAGYKWFTCPTCDGTAKISQDQLEQINKDHLRSELQKAKELNGEFMQALKELWEYTPGLPPGHNKGFRDAINKAESLIKKSNP